MTAPSLKHPGRWIWLILLVPVVMGVVRLRFDVEVFDLLPPELPVVQGLQLYQEYFANARQLIVTLRTTDAEQATEAAQRVAEALRQHPDLVNSVIWQPPWMENPAQLSELIAYLWLNQPPAVFDAWTNRLSPTEMPSTLDSVRDELATSLSPDELARLSYDPFGFTRLPEAAAGASPSFGQGQQLFGSKDGKFRMIFVQASHDLRSYRQCETWLKSISSVAENAARSVTNSGPISLAYTGRPAFVAEVASGMEHDMTYSVGGTAAIIAILFWLAHRRVKPMLWLLTLLAVILGCTLALGGLVFGTINVVSMGFAAILLGLAVDYAVVHYQEALAHPGFSIAQVRHAIAPSIFWAATTTIVSFLMLNFGGLPGLGQLGTLVALGVALSACIMIFEFLPPLFKGRDEASVAQPADLAAARPPTTARRSWPAWAWAITAFAVLAPIGVLVWGGPPAIDPTANALRPRGSQAYAALEEVQRLLSQQKEPLWLIVEGATDADVANRLSQVQSVLNRGVSNGVIAGFTLPSALWPQPAHQAANRPIAEELAKREPQVEQAAAKAGFAANSLAMTKAILRTWQRAGATPQTFWPTNELSRWILEKFTARTPKREFALGVVNPRTNGPPAAAQVAWLNSQLPKEQVWLSGWELLGHAIFLRVRSNLWKVLLPMVLLVLASLWFAFHRKREILLAVGALLLSGLCLLAAMRLAHWSWNLLNLMAIPLILGTGVDYSIFMQSALRRHHGDRGRAHFAVGRALLLCGGTAIAGFGSLAFSSNAGMASLGQVCAVGIACNMLLAVFLLPVWWQAAARSGQRGARTLE